MKDRTAAVIFEPMAKDSIWERGVTLPRRGPLRWLMVYLSVVSAAGCVLWLGLGVVSPTTADPTTGHVYRVPGSRRSPDFYVQRFDAYALRIALAHVSIFFLLGGGVALFNAGAKRSTTATKEDPEP